ncbi:hypothetical protein [Paratractidigestivibacter sp.]|nr:hypothetical protein [Paratractidigestivibacter sp.]
MEGNLGHDLGTGACAHMRRDWPAALNACGALRAVYGILGI